jgi:hypothetical protein
MISAAALSERVEHELSAGVGKDVVGTCGQRWRFAYINMGFALGWLLRKNA